MIHIVGFTWKADEQANYHYSVRYSEDGKEPQEKSGVFTEADLWDQTIKEIVTAKLGGGYQVRWLV